MDSNKSLMFTVGIQSPPFTEGGYSYKGKYKTFKMTAHVYDWSGERYDEIIERESQSIIAQASEFLADGWTVTSVKRDITSDADAIELVKFGKAEIRFRPDGGGQFHVYLWDKKSPSGVSRVWGWNHDKADWIHSRGIRTHLSQAF
jgi:hypothetical protein